MTEMCFDAKDDADEGDFFLQQSISYIISDASCPFQDATMCLNEESHVVHFSTGPMHARATGINVSMTIQFSRDTTCLPIVTNETFVHAKNLNDSLGYYYYYELTRHYSLTSIIMNSRIERERSNLYSVKYVLPRSESLEMKMFNLR